MALALGPTAGLGAARVVASHYSVMARGLSQLFAAGPAVVDGLGKSYKGSTDHQQAKEDLGSSDIHTRNGVVDDEVLDEQAAFASACRFLSYLPGHTGALAARTECRDPENRRSEALLDLVPREPKQVYSMRRAMEMVFDRDSIFEMGRQWGPRGDHRLCPAGRVSGGRAGQRPKFPPRIMGSAHGGKGRTLRQTGRPVPLAHRASGAQSRLYDRQSGGGGGDDPLWRERDERDLPRHEPVRLGHPAPRLWHCGQRDEQRG